MFEDKKISSNYSENCDAIIYHGDCLSLLKEIPTESVKLVVTSPPYIELSRDRVKKEIEGTLKTRPMYKPIYDPSKAKSKLTEFQWENQNNQCFLFDSKKEANP